MRLGGVATLLDEKLSELDVHGGTSRRFFEHSSETERPERFVCSFSARLDPKGDSIARRLSILADGHKTICGEIVTLCVDRANISDELRAAAEAWKIFAQPSAEPTRELSQAISEFLSKLGVADRPQNGI
jgi:hypothetical protein